MFSEAQPKVVAKSCKSKKGSEKAFSRYKEEKKYYDLGSQS